MPTPPTGDMTWAASPIKSRPGLYQRRQRLDSTHVLGVVRQMSSLECVRETLRLTLESLAEAVAEAQRPAAWVSWWERYVESKLEYRAEAQTLWEKFDQAGTDAWALLEWVMALPVTLQAQPKVTLLAQVFDEYFERVEQHWRGRRPRVSGSVVNPHEPEARTAARAAQRSQQDEGTCSSRQSNQPSA